MFPAIIRPPRRPRGPRARRIRRAPARRFRRRMGSFRLTLPRVLRAAWICGAGALAAFIALRNAAMYRALKRSRRRLELDFAAMPRVSGGRAAHALPRRGFQARDISDAAALETPERTRMAVLHEETHFRHGDHIWALLRCALLCVYWFDPFVWLAAYLSRRDCELACDESCVKRLGPERRAEYGGALIDLIDRGRRAGTARGGHHHVKRQARDKGAHRAHSPLLPARTSRRSRRSWFSPSPSPPAPSRARRTRRRAAPEGSPAGTLADGAGVRRSGGARGLGIAAQSMRSTSTASSSAASARAISRITAAWTRRWTGCIWNT